MPIGFETLYDQQVVGSEVLSMSSDCVDCDGNCDNCDGCECAEIA